MAKQSAPTGPKPKFMSLGKSKYIHVVHTKAYDLKHSQCQQVRKYQVADKIGKDKGISPEAASVLEPCPHCETTGVLKSLVTPADRKAASKAATQDLLDKVRDEQKPKAKTKDAPKTKADKTDKPVKQKMVKSGPKSLGGDAEKADILRQFAEEHGWTVYVTEDKPGLKFIAVRGAERITCWFDGGKYDMSRCGYTEVEGSDWQGKLRAAHACRRQMSGEGRERPHPKPGAGRSAPRGKREEPTPETESPEDAHKRVPFSIDDDEVVIIDAVKGKALRWRNSLTNEIEESTLPATANGTKRPKIVITTHPTKNRRILSFFSVAGMSEHGEVYGPERSVALDKIIRVVG